MKGKSTMFKSSVFVVLSALAFCGCAGDSSQKNVIATRYVHKFGFHVPKAEWEEKQYPGQVITTMTDGKTIAETYEEGILHGARTETYPHSQTTHILETYDHGRLVKRMTYNVRGVPQQEETFKSDTNVLVTSWYPTGTPKSKEEFKDKVLVNGQYFSFSNEVDSRVENGNGERTVRNPSGDILSKEVFSNYAITYVETYYPNNSPYTSTSYQNGKLHGEKKVFAMTGEPLSVENYYQGNKHGISAYFQNGSKYLEVSYAYGLKDGEEKEFIDGAELVKKTTYRDGKKHGPYVVYCDGSPTTSWYFDDQRVSHKTFGELTLRDDLIMSMQH